MLTPTLWGVWRAHGDSKINASVICKNSKICLENGFHHAVDTNSIKTFELVDPSQHVNVNMYLVSTEVGVTWKGTYSDSITHRNILGYCPLIWTYLILICHNRTNRKCYNTGFPCCIYCWNLLWISVIAFFNMQCRALALGELMNIGSLILISC